MMNIEHGVPQGYVLEPLLLVIYVNDLNVNLLADRICNTGIRIRDGTSIVSKERTQYCKTIKSKIVMKQVKKRIVQQISTLLYTKCNFFYVHENAT